MDPLTSVSLAARVCAGDAGLDNSGSQASSFNVLSSYLFSNPILFSFSNGPMTMGVCLVVWTTSVVYELGGALKALKAIGCVGGTTTDISCNFQEGTVSVNAVSTLRLVGFTLVQICRIGVAISLWLSGTLFLVNTISISDLLLNTAALQFIMDRKFYASAGPSSISPCVLQLTKCSLLHLHLQVFRTWSVTTPA